MLDHARDLYPICARGNQLIGRNTEEAMAFVTTPICAPRTSFSGTPARCVRRTARASERARLTRMTLAEPSGTSTRALEIFMPALSSTMETGKIVQWLKQPGDYIKKGEPVMVVESDKADMDVESFEEGYLALVMVNEGDSCNVGETVALMAATKEEIESVKECKTACIVSGSGSRHDGTTAVETPTAPPPAAAAAEPSAASAAAPAAAPAPAPAVEKPKMRELFMPALSSTMSEGKVVDWLKSEGEEVKKGEMVMVVESDKADMDVESFEDGYLAHVLVQAGESSPVGEAVGYLAVTEADIPKVKAWALSQTDTSKLAQSNGVAVDKPAAAPEAAAPAPAAATPTAAPTPLPIINEGRIIATPYAKQVAKELGVDLRTVRGTGEDGCIHESNVRAAAAAAPAAPATPYKSTKLIATPEAKKIAKKENIKLETVTGTGSFGRITEEDVLRAAGKAPAPAPAAASKKPAAAEPAAPKEKRSAPVEMPAGAVAMNAMQKAVVKNMNASLTVPAFRVEYTIDTGAFDALYAKVKTKGVSVSALLAKAVALTLEKHPLLNAAYAPDAIAYRPDINIGMAVALSDGGLITPVLKNANSTDIYTLARAWRDLVKRAAAKKLKPDEYNSGTFFISNMGMFGVESFDAILPPGAPAIMAVAASKPVVAMLDNGLVGVKKQMKVNLTADHRHIYGANVAEFLRDLAHLIEKEPMSLML